MKFRNAYSEPDRVASPSGSRLRKNYIKSYDNGSSELIESGVEDVYDSIQKSASGTVIEDLIRRAERGDTTAIPVPVDSYADLSDMPSDLLSLHQKLQRCKDDYNSLPATVRGAFNNNYQEFLASVSDGSVYDKLTAASPSSPSVPPLSSDEIQKIRTSIGGISNA